MLRNLGLDLDLSKVGKDLKLQLALPNKTIKKNISDVTQANLEGFEINGLPKLTFEIPHKIQERVGKTDEIRIVDNPDIKMIKEKMLIKATWYNKKRINWFRINSITQTDSQDFVTMRVEADALQSELRATNISTATDPIDAVDYFTHVLSQTMWQLGTVSEKIKGTYRSFDDNKRTRYEAINNGLETFGAVADWDEENRVLNILSISDIREFRGVVLKKENYVSSLEIESNSEDIVTRLYVYGNEGKGIENVNPTGMPYIEDFSYFIYPFERDLEKNVITHSDYMSDELCHAILDLKLLQDEYNPRIKDLQTNLNNAYGDLSRNNLMLVELQGQLVTTQALLDTAKATNDYSLIAQRELEVQTKEIEISNKVEEIDAIQSSIDLWENTIVSYQELISTTSFTQALQNELSLFIYEKEFSDDRYIEEAELLEAGQEQFDKYQRPTKSFTIQLASFVNSIESQYIGGRLQIGEEVLIKSTKLKTEYKSIVLGYNVDFKTGDYQLIISDNMDDIDSMDKLATLIYKADSSSTILNNNKYKWDNVTSLKDEVEAWRDKEIKTVENRIVAGANESVVIDNRGIQAHNPDFPDERIIIQSGVMALSRDGGKTWSTSVTPYGVMAETIIGKIIAGNNLVITNDSGSFVIDNGGLTIDMDDIHIMSGQSGTPEDMIQMWNNLLLTYDEIASDNLVNEYEKNQLEKQWTKIVNIHSSMVEQFIRGWQKLEDEGIPKPIEYNEYITAYENLNTYLNTTKQSDGFALLDVANRTSTSSINPLTFSQKFKEYEMKKASFESVIAMEFTNGAINVLEEGISLTYTKNSEILTQLNLSEEGVRIDGKLLEINSKTEFNADLVMNAGVIKDKDNGIIIDLNAGEITLNKPIRINAGSNVATKDEVVESAEGIQIGGRNLWREGLCTLSTSTINGEDYWVVKGINTPWWENISLDSSYFEEGTQYTVQFIGIVDVHFNKALFKYTDGSLSEKSFMSGVRETFTSDVGKTIQYFTIDTGGYQWAGFIKKKTFKIEKGTIATDWTPAPEDARTYKAWANSADGTADFTRVYPNENLWIDSLSESGHEVFGNVAPSTDTHRIMPELVPVDGTEIVYQFWNPNKVVNRSNSNRIAFLREDKTFISHITNRLNGETYKSEPISLPSGTKYLRIGFIQGTPTDRDMAIKFKVEVGTTPTIYTTNTADSLTGSVPKYVGFSPLDSDKPSDYEWIINPEWTQASAEESLTNKADKGEIDDINNALGDKADNGAFNELKTALELFQDSYRGFVKDGGQHEQDLINLEGRMTQLLLSLDSKVLELDFLETYMKLGEEGFMIGKDDSQIKMLLKNDRLSFMDAGQEVAFFSGQSFYINRGAIVQSLQVGEHKITNLGNGHTIFQWVGA